MTDKQLNMGNEALKILSSIMNDLKSTNNINHFLKMDETSESVIILGNTDGLVYLATSILELALSAEDQNHYHFGAGMLDNCVKELEVFHTSSPFTK